MAVAGGMDRESRTGRPSLRRLMEGVVKLDDIVSTLTEDLNEMVQPAAQRYHDRRQHRGRRDRSPSRPHRGRRDRPPSRSHHGRRDRSRSRGSRRRERRQPQQQQQQQQPQQQHQQQPQEQQQQDANYLQPGGPFGVPEAKARPAAPSSSSTSAPEPKTMPAPTHNFPRGWPAWARVRQEVHDSDSEDLD